MGKTISEAKKRTRTCVHFRAICLRRIVDSDLLLFNLIWSIHTMECQIAIFMMKWIYIAIYDTVIYEKYEFAYSDDQNIFFICI